MPEVPHWRFSFLSLGARGLPPGAATPQCGGTQTCHGPGGVASRWLLAGFFRSGQLSMAGWFEGSLFGGVKRQKQGDSTNLLVLGYAEVIHVCTCMYTFMFIHAATLGG